MSVRKRMYSGPMAVGMPSPAFRGCPAIRTRSSGQWKIPGTPCARCDPSHPTWHHATRCRARTSRGGGVRHNKGRHAPQDHEHTARTGTHVAGAHSTNQRYERRLLRKVHVVEVEVAVLRLHHGPAHPACHVHDDSRTQTRTQTQTHGHTRAAGKRTSRTVDDRRHLKSSCPDPRAASPLSSRTTGREAALATASCVRGVRS